LFYTNKDIKITKDDTLYLSSDGYIDQHSPDRSKFGPKKLESLLASIKSEPLEKQKEKLEKELNKHMQKEDQRDDITLIGLRPLLPIDG